MATSSNRWVARVALIISILAAAAVMGAFSTLGIAGPGAPAAIQTTASASPSSTPCQVPLPAPPPVCPSKSASPSSTAKPTSSAKPSSSPGSTASPSPSTSPGGGVNEKHDSKVTIEFTAAFRSSAAQFDGVVKSVRKCKRSRQVTLMHVQEGPDLAVGRDTSNRSGAWRIPDPSAKGRYYAKLRKRTFTQGDVTVICGAARSRTVRAAP